MKLLRWAGRMILINLTSVYCKRPLGRKAFRLTWRGGQESGIRNEPYTMLGAGFGLEDGQEVREPGRSGPSTADLPEHRLPVRSGHYPGALVRKATLYP